MFRINLSSLIIHIADAHPLIYGLQLLYLLKQVTVGKNERKYESKNERKNERMR